MHSLLSCSYPLTISYTFLHLFLEQGTICDGYLATSTDNQFDMSPFQVRTCQDKSLSMTYKNKSPNKHSFSCGDITKFFGFTYTGHILPASGLDINEDTLTNVKHIKNTGRITPHDCCCFWRQFIT